MPRRILVSLALVSLAGCAGRNEVGEIEYDISFSQEPRVSIDSPALGAFVPTAADGMVEVKGRAKGKSLDVNGRAVSVDGNGNFSVKLAATPGINVIDARINSLWGGWAQRAFVYGEFAKPAARIAGGVQVRATARAFDDGDPDLDDFSTIGVRLLNLHATDYVKQIPPFSFDFGIGSVDATVAGAGFAKDKTALQLSPRAGGARTAGSLSDLAIDLGIVLHLGGDYAAAAKVTVDTVRFSGDLAAHYATGAVLAKVTALDLALGAMTVTTDVGLPYIDQVLTWLANEFRPLLAAALAKQIEESAANHFAGTLNQLGLPRSFDLTPLGVNATVEADEEMDGAAFDGAGVTLSAASALRWPKLPPGAPGEGAAGSLLIGGDEPAAFPPAPFAASVAFDTINQAAFAIWGQGGLHRQVYPAKSWTIFKLDPVMAAPRLPPVLLPAGEGKVKVFLGDVIVSSALHAWRFDGNFSATISAVADVALDFDPATLALRTTLAGKPTIYIDVNDVLGVVPDALLAPLSQALQAIAPTIVANLMKPIEVPLPALPLAPLLPDEEGSIGLAPPVAVSVDAEARRVTVGGELAAY